MLKYTTGQKDMSTEKASGAIKMDQLPAKVYLGLGCNLGERLEALKKAIEMLKSLGTVTAESKIYESPPWGYEDSHPYLNMACEMEVRMSAEELHRATLLIEQKLGREMTKRRVDQTYLARTMDIDLLFFGNEKIETKTLTIPHPRLHLRNFALRPMVDIAPNYEHPVLGLTMTELLARSKDPAALHQLN